MPSPSNEPASAPLVIRVFISYSDAEQDQALELADRLRAEGVNATLNAYVAHPEPAWASREIREADFVIVVCSNTYKQGYESRNSGSAGLAWESMLIRQLIYETSGIFRLVPVVFNNSADQDVPEEFRAYTIYRLPQDYESLYRYLTGQPATPPPPLTIAHARLSPSNLTRDAPRVYVSHAPEDEDIALDLADMLRESGIDAWLDAYILGTPTQGWPRWREKEIDQADHVLLVCTRAYIEQLEGKTPIDSNKAIAWELHVIRSRLYKHQTAGSNIISIHFDGPNLPAPVNLPFVLTQNTSYTLPSNKDRLLDHLISSYKSLLENAAMANTRDALSLPKDGSPKRNKAQLHEVFVSRGVPRHTLVSTAVHGKLAYELSKPRIGLIVEGPSGIGKTVAVKQALSQRHAASTTEWPCRWLHSTVAKDRMALEEILRDAAESLRGHLVIDDFHHLPDSTKVQVASLMKVLAESDDVDAKIIAIGVPKTRQSLIAQIPELQGGADIIVFPRATNEEIFKLIELGETALNITFSDREDLVLHAQGSFAVAQSLCEQAARNAGISETSEHCTHIRAPIIVVVEQHMRALQPSFHARLHAFAMLDSGVLMRGAGLSLLMFLGNDETGSIIMRNVEANSPGLEEAFAELTRRAANSPPDGAYSSTGQPDWRECIYFDVGAGILAIDDPKLHFYLRHLGWAEFWRECGVPISPPAIEGASTPPDLGGVRVLPMTPAVTDLVILEREVQNLEHRYSGIGGTKVFWLAALTLVPLLVPLKVPMLSLRMSVATIIYAAYHGLGAHVWLGFRQLRESKLSIAERRRTIKQMARMDRVVRFLGWVVLVLLIMTVLAKLELIIGDERHSVPLPEWLVGLLGVPKP
jgi:hypothetical protein